MIAFETIHQMMAVSAWHNHQAGRAVSAQKLDYKEATNAPCTSQKCKITGRSGGKEM